MHRAIPAVSGVILIVLGLFGALVGVNNYVEHRQQENKIASFGEYYRGLARGCYAEESVNCCLGSVSNMQKNKSLLIPETGCPAGTRQEMLKCLGTYKWCEKETAE